MVLIAKKPEIPELIVDKPSDPVYIQVNVLGKKASLLLTNRQTYMSRKKPKFFSNAYILNMLWMSDKPFSCMNVSRQDVF